MTKTKDQKWEEEFEKEFINWNFHHKASPCFCDAVSVKNFISKKISKAREDMGEGLRMKERPIWKLNKDYECDFCGRHYQVCECEQYNKAVEEQNEKIDNYLKK